MQLRLATLQDMPQIAEMAKAFYDEHPDHTCEFCPETTWAVLETLIKDLQSVFIVLVNDQDDVVGGLGATMSSPYYSKDVIGAEMFWYVHPDYRRGSSSVALIRAYEAWGEEVGCKSVHMSCLNGLQDEILSKLFVRMGYHKSELSFIKEL
jgi:GNAT superfamily N-acetyltransferase